MPVASGTLVNLIGGHPALDLINTVSWRLDQSRWTDRLDTVEQLVDWGQAANLFEVPAATPLATPTPTQAENVMRTSRSLRENAYLALCDHLAGRPTSATVLSALQDSMSSLMRAGTLSPTFPLRLIVSPTSVTQIPDAIAASLFDLFFLQDLGRLRQCEGDGCGWLYLDRSRNRSRRWCSSADCGNRHRVNQFARRSRLSAAESPPA